MPQNLLVIIPDRVSDIVKKGEYTARYYNPGDLFSDVHIVMTNDDQPDGALLQATVGTARLHLHNLPIPGFRKTWGWQPVFLRNWVTQGLALARQIKPALIRAHGNFENGFLASRIAKGLSIPLVVSLHINPDIDKRGRVSWSSDWRTRLIYERTLAFEKETLGAADWVLPVYEPIRSYAARRGARHIKVCYNVLNGEHLRRKESYALHLPPHIISVGRQFREKNPENLIRAVARLDAELTLVGDGPYHESLERVAKECGVAERVHFHRAMPNDELCARLPDYDIFATHSEFAEIGKSVLEPLLTGLPVVINRRIGEPVPELNGDWVVLVENSVEGYHTALERLLSDHVAREVLGRCAYKHAQARYAPAKTEQAIVDVYRSLLPGLRANGIGKAGAE